MVQEAPARNRRLTISVAEHVVDAARELGARRHQSLSRVISEAILAERRRLLDQEMIEGYRALAEENRVLAEQALIVDNETWPVE